MSHRLPVEIAPERGYLRLGTIRVEVAAGEDGVWRVGGAARVRPVTFAQRGALVCEAIAVDDPAAGLVSRIVRTSIIESDGVDADLLAAITVALAGGGEPTQSFAEAARVAGEREGWSWDRIMNAPAWLVDRSGTRTPDSFDGWSTIVFPSDAPSDLDAMTRTMSRNLLRRSIDVAPAPGHPARVNHVARRSASIDAGANTSAALRTPAPDATATGTSRSSVSHATTTADVGRSATPTSSGIHARSQAAAALADRSTTSAAWPATMSRELVSGFETRPAIADPAAIASPRNLGLAASAPVRWPSLATQSAPVFSRQTATLSSTQTIEPSTAAIDPAEWLDDVARALEAECDLRGLDR